MRRKRLRCQLASSGVLRYSPDTTEATSTDGGDQTARRASEHLDRNRFARPQRPPGRQRRDTQARASTPPTELGYVANQSGRNLRQGTHQRHRLHDRVRRRHRRQLRQLLPGRFRRRAARPRRAIISTLLVLPCAGDEDPSEYLQRMVSRGAPSTPSSSPRPIASTRVSISSRKARIPFIALGRSTSGAGEYPWVDLDFDGVANRGHRPPRRQHGHRRIAVGLPATTSTSASSSSTASRPRSSATSINFDPSAAHPRRLVGTGRLPDRPRDSRA